MNTDTLDHLRRHVDADHATGWPNHPRCDQAIQARTRGDIEDVVAGAGAYRTHIARANGTGDAAFPEIGVALAYVACRRPVSTSSSAVPYVGRRIRRPVDKPHLAPTTSA